LRRSGAVLEMPALSEWLQLMLAEIARKRDDVERAREEEAERSRDAGTAGAREADGERARNEGRKRL